MLNCLHLNKNIGSVEKYVCQIMENCIVVKISNSKFKYLVKSKILFIYFKSEYSSAIYFKNNYLLIYMMEKYISIYLFHSHDFTICKTYKI